MAIFKGSRYYDVQAAQVEYLSLNENEAAYEVVWYEFPGSSLATFIFHVYVEGERLDEIAYKYYERPGSWWRIMEVNPHITDPLSIPAGTVLRIPK